MQIGPRTHVQEGPMKDRIENVVEDGAARELLLLAGNRRCCVMVGRRVVLALGLAFCLEAAAEPSWGQPGVTRQGQTGKSRRKRRRKRETVQGMSPMAT